MPTRPDNHANNPEAELAKQLIRAVQEKLSRPNYGVDLAKLDRLIMYLATPFADDFDPMRETESKRQIAIFSEAKAWAAYVDPFRYGITEGASRSYLHAVRTHLRQTEKATAGNPEIATIRLAVQDELDTLQGPLSVFRIHRHSQAAERTRHILESAQRTLEDNIETENDYLALAGRFLVLRRFQDLRNTLIDAWTSVLDETAAEILQTVVPGISQSGSLGTTVTEILQVADGRIPEPAIQHDRGMAKPAIQHNYAADSALTGIA